MRCRSTILTASPPQVVAKAPRAPGCGGPRRRGATPAHTSSSSCSLCSSAPSTSASYFCVSLSSSFSARVRSSAEMSPSCSSPSRSWRAPRRAWRMLTLPLLGHAAHDPHELLAALLGQRREVEADDLAVVAGRQPEAAGLQRLLDGADRPLVVRADHEQPRLGHREAGDLLQRHLGAVVVDRQLLDQRRCGPPGADPGELGPGVVDRLRHLVAGLVEDHRDHVVVRHGCSWIESDGDARQQRPGPAGCARAAPPAARCRRLLVVRSQTSYH